MRAATIEITADQYLELEKIAIGAFHPLNGFMNERQFLSVVNEMRLPGGDVFTLPVLLDVEIECAKLIKDESVVDLIFDGVTVGLIYPEDFFSCNRPPIASKIYGTNDPKHPGVEYFYNMKDVFVGGIVELFIPPSFNFSQFELTPKETKEQFKKMGWKTIVGFQTRNVPHRAHEYLLRTALELADGLFVQPLVGKKRSGDYTPEAIIKGYQALIGGILPAKHIFFGLLSTLMRYAGPREAVFHALIRRNYGCTHFIVGRDHAGVGEWYGLYQAQELAAQFEGELGIEILKLKGPFYCSVCDGITTEKTCAHVDSDCIEHISGTYMRSILSAGAIPEKHLMRTEVVKALHGVECFIKK